MTDSIRTWWREAGGSVADLGVLLPIALSLIIVNGLSTTAVLLPAGLAYLMVARVYGVPVSVQPLKAFGAAAIAAGAGADVIAAGSLIMGVVFFVLGSLGLVGWAARIFPHAVIRGVQISVGLTLLSIAWKMVAKPPASFAFHVDRGWAILLALVMAGVLLFWKRSSALVLVLVGFGFALYQGMWSTDVGIGNIHLGPVPFEFPHMSSDAFFVALLALVLPQLPLTFANSCVAPADAAQKYFPGRSAKVTPDRLARTLGFSNILVAGIAGMPMCHGAGGMTAHALFGARTWRAPAFIGTVLVVTALVFAQPLAAALPWFPTPVLAALLAVAGLSHLFLAADLRGFTAWAVALGVGVAGISGNLAAGIVVGIVLDRLVRKWQQGRWSRGNTPEKTGEYTGTSYLRTAELSADIGRTSRP